MGKFSIPLYIIIHELQIYFKNHSLIIALLHNNFSQELTGGTKGGNSQNTGHAK